MRSKSLEILNQGLQSSETRASGHSQKLSDAYQKLSNDLIKFSDKATQSQERFIKSIERQADLAGKSGTERLIADRDRLIKKYAQDEQAVSRLTAAYKKLIDAQSGEHDNSFAKFGESVKSFIENPLAAAGSQATSLAESLGPVAVGIGAVVGVAVALVGASYEAAKGLGEWGVQMNDLQVRTGFTAKEVGEFRFAAKAAGADSSVFERSMRGLTSALEDNSSKGDKAREWLTKWGVDISEVRSGTANTAEVLEKVGKGLTELPAGFERNKAAIDIFKKAGVELIPTLVDLDENLKTAREQGFGFDQKDITAAKQMNAELARVDTTLENLIRKDIKTPLAHAFEFMTFSINNNIEAIKKDWELFDKYILHLGHLPKPTAPQQPQSDAGGSDAALFNQLGGTALAARDAKNVEATLKRWGYTKEGLEDALTKAKQNEADALDKLRTHDKTSVGDARKELSDLNAAHAEVTRLTEAIKAQNKAESEQLSIIEKIAKLRKDVEFQLSHPYGISKTDEQLKSFVETPGITPAQIEQVTGILTPERIKASKDLIAKAIAESQAEGRRVTEEISKNLGNQYSKQDKQFLDQNQKSIKDAETTAKLYGGALDADRALRESQALGANRLAGVFAEDPQDKLRVQLQQFDIQKQFAAELLQQELDDAAQKHSEDLKFFGDNSRLEAEQQEIRLKYAKQVSDLELQGEIAVGEERKRQFDAVKSATENLYQTLFTHPKNFGKQLSSTVQGALLKPITEGFAGVTSQVLTPVIYGKDGKSGIAGSLKGLFGKGAAPDTLKLSTDSNTAATVSNSVALVNLTNTLAAGLGVAAPSVPSGVSGSSTTILTSSGGGGIDLSSPPGIGQFGTPTLPSFGGSGGGAVDSDGNPTFSTTAYASAGGGAASLSGGLLPGLLKSATKNGSFDLSALKKNLGGFTRNKDGSISGVNGLAGAALVAGGSELAKSGLLGNARGTGLGIFEAGAGGAALGLKYGGPLGALIGAAAGTLAGIGEKLAGVESPLNEAKRLIKQKYGVTVDNKFAQSIVQLAQSKYGGKVSLAVEDPQTRQSLQLYAAGTGQKVPLGNTTPFVGSLIQQGGQTTQGASYLFGQAYTYQSGFATSGGTSSTTIPNPAGQPMVFNIQGGSTSAFLQGQVFTPDFVQGQLTTANNYSNGRVANSAVNTGNPMLATYGG